MTKFKVGDKIKPKNNGASLKEGVYTVIAVHDHGDFQVRGVSGIFTNCWYELVKSSPKPHPHAELIKAWADGAEIQHRGYGDVEWRDTIKPTWHQELDYRIKPDEDTISDRIKELEDHLLKLDADFNEQLTKTKQTLNDIKQRLEETL